MAGHKTDVADAEWLAELLAHGLIRASFVPAIACAPGAAPERPCASKAVCVAAAMLTTVYHMLRNGARYHDLGPDHFDQRSKDAQAQRLVKRLGGLGYDVAIWPRPQTA